MVKNKRHKKEKEEEEVTKDDLILFLQCAKLRNGPELCMIEPKNVDELGNLSFLL